MVGQQRLEHAELGVTDLDDAVSFYTDVMGMIEIERSSDTVYLGCGLDENFDIAVTEGGTGTRHFAVRVDNSDELARYERNLDEEGVKTKRVDGEEPNQVEGIRFSMPMGVDMELVLVEDMGYRHSDEARVPGRSSVCPVDIDHITLGSLNPQENVEFLEDVVGFNVSEVLLKEDESWRGAFTRWGVHHHDVAVLGRPDGTEYNLRHIAWTMSSIDHMKAFIDNLAQAGYELEVTIHRHYAGDNLAAYFWEPGGNRFEICAEMATLDPNTPTNYCEPGEGYTAWGGVHPPESYRKDGS
ncbi:catechol 2,3-dioxygenase [Natrarchaeobius halalkaliphilus]|uniref:Catechol 2,3-dioxygenase n=1 Tax=Natrarchaeobius halalkaliphilus TaxID=1679091 RepID=A0A3N6M063_9EURY|nr:VOC family protein [Natrarchaeobius halalkaliphilus]RQG87914.1 catechol 2,3-dioxygenase [Natrarchaeobius halalkaliphilus]